MAETSSTEPDPGPVPALIDRLDENLTALAAAVDREELDPDTLVVVTQRFETFRNRMSSVDHRIVGQIDRAGLAEKHCVATVPKLVTQLLRISPGDAARRVRAAATVGPNRSLFAEELPARSPILAAAQAAGELNPDQVNLVERALHRVDIIHPALLEEAEATLVGHARLFGPPELATVCTRLVDAIDPDGTRPDDAVHAEQRFLTLSACRDGMSSLTGRLTPAAAAQLAAVLGPLATPKQTVETGPQGGERQAPDPRSYQQRLHDALEDACARLLRTPGLPESGGIPATVIITMTDDQLASKTGHAQTSTGQHLSIPEALKIADQAHIIPTVLTGRGQPLWLGRTRRLANPAQTCALIARDGGCSFPGSATRPDWCDRHHINRLAGRRDHRHQQPDPALPFSPHPPRHRRLDLPHQPRRTPRLGPTDMARPPTTIADQPPHPTTTPSAGVMRESSISAATADRSVSEGGLEPPCPVKGTSTSS